MTKVIYVLLIFTILFYLFIIRTGMPFSRDTLDFRYSKSTTLFFSLLEPWCCFERKTEYFLLFLENMNGRGDMFLCNLLLSIFLGPYTVKYFCINICVTVLTGEYYIIWRVASDFSLKRMNNFCMFFCPNFIIFGPF